MLTTLVAAKSRWGFWKCFDRLRLDGQWCAERVIELWHIQPRKPDQNAFIERYNRAYRTEMLNAYVFESLEQVRKISAGDGAITKSSPMSRWRACRPPHIELNVKPEVLY